MAVEETAVLDQVAPVANDVASSQPPPATDGSAPWGSFYTTPADGGGAAKAPAKPKKSKNARRRATADRRKAKERREQGERRERAVEPGDDRREGERRDASAEPAPKAKRKSFRLGSRTGGGRRVEDQRRSFRLRRGRRQEVQDAPTPAPVATAAKSRRYAEPHVLVGVVGGTIIALAALMIALLYMIGTAA